MCNKPEPVQHCKYFYNESSLWCQAPCRKPAPELGRPPWQTQLISAVLCGHSRRSQVQPTFIGLCVPFRRQESCLGGELYACQSLHDTSISLQLTVVLATWLNLYVDITSAHCCFGHVTKLIRRYHFSSLSLWPHDIQCPIIFIHVTLFFLPGGVPCMLSAPFLMSPFLPHCLSPTPFFFSPPLPVSDTLPSYLPSPPLPALSHPPLRLPLCLPSLFLNKLS